MVWTLPGSAFSLQSLLLWGDSPCRRKTNRPSRSRRPRRRPTEPPPHIALSRIARDKAASAVAGVRLFAAGAAGIPAVHHRPQRPDMLRGRPAAAANHADPRLQQV